MHTSTLLPEEKKRNSVSAVGCHRGSKVCTETSNISTLRTNVMTPKCCVDNLSTLMVEAAAFFHKHELHCWLDWGSLLGVVREGKLLAWDRDVDFGFHAHAENAILEAFANDGRPHRANNGDIGFVLETGLFYVPNWGRIMREIEPRYPAFILVKRTAYMLICTPIIELKKDLEWGVLVQALTISKENIFCPYASLTGKAM